MKSTTPVALVTGAGRGLGAALAERLASAGYAVAVHYHHSRSGAERTVARIRRAGGTAELFAGDLTQEKVSLAIAGKIKQRWGRLDVLINNAGVYHAKSLARLTAEEWFEGLNTTATTVFFLTRACLPLLRKAGAGRVVNIGDSSADRPTARDLAVGYHVGKTGVLMLTRSFAREEARHGVTVNAVSPGWLENSVGLPGPGTIPAGRYGTFADIGHAVDFLLQRESGYVTGTNLVAGGGWNLR